MRAARVGSGARLVPYTPNVWIDHDPSKPASAARLTVMETGISGAHTAAAAAQTTADAALPASDTKIPTQAENDALVGTNGTPGTGNAFVTTTDARLPTQGENDALAGSSGTPSSSNKYVTSSDSRLVGIQTVVSVKDYGAVGDGSTDDTSSIAAAIAAAGSVPVFFPPSTGNYMISAPLVLKAGTRLLGWHRPEWMPFTITTIRNPAIQATAGFSGTALVQIQDHALSGAAVDPNGGSIEGLCFAGANVGEHGLNFQGYSFDWTIRDVEVMAVSGSGFVSAGYTTHPQQELSFWGCHAHDNGGAGWSFGGGSYDHRLVGCVAHTNSGDGFLLGPGTSSVELVSCRAEWNLGNGFLLYGPSGGAGIGKITMNGCVTDRNSLHGVYIESSVANAGPIHLVGHFSNRDGSSGSHSGIRVHNTTELVILTGLTQKIGVDDGGGGTLSPVYGVDVTGASHAMLGVQGSTAGVTAGFHWDAAGGAVKSLGYFQETNNGAPTYFPPSTS